MPDRAQVRLRPMERSDAPAVLGIYAAGIATGNATFEIDVPSWERFDASRLAQHRWVALNDGSDAVIGWVAASATSVRPAYAGVLEPSVYVADAARGRGVGAALLGQLIESTEAAGVWTLQSGVFPENTASLTLHRTFGFRTIGTRERIAQRHGVWRDVLLIERRSRVAGC